MTPTQDLAPATGCQEFFPASAAKPQTKPLLCMSPTGTETNGSHTTADSSSKHGNFMVAKDYPQIKQFEVSVPPPNTPFESPADLKVITDDKIVGESSGALRIEKAVQSVGSITANFGTQTCQEQLIE